MKQIQYEELSTSTLTQLINRKESFEVVGLGGRLTKAVSLVENKIESNAMTCRAYTVGRIGAVAGSFFGGITGAIGVVSAAGIAIHNILTFNPDYEIEKYPIDNRLIVKYKK
ncbi:hypothetical protein [Aquipseudomonas alcaligenes]|uniref:Uncharacterized protein n=1 Tax=Aquipseudomonas alcaligenes TaxID=43263 RepID=A0AA37FND8_AQUAC|nr:hypothetical protein [Pseudomonas alcaligenes]BCR24413.1 hypothetical protein KAM426_19400 [Pseudomonas alcaligenes]GIZ69057.1 hypothetical protein KAM428_41420 [Pseudomonas alcaligenes]GIZ73445.1 hypothetical protein KAM429_42060 [Pseudomonas alcaligenes]GIZ77805.1 hypothetical protein KAM430_42140 [Pseudomonas alcaligenes]GIZ82148.1 hypothetical protein KAM432_41960 [Pseudomonas alcaligenes]